MTSLAQRPPLCCLNHVKKNTRRQSLRWYLSFKWFQRSSVILLFRDIKTCGARSFHTVLFWNYQTLISKGDSEHELLWQEQRHFSKLWATSCCLLLLEMARLNPFVQDASGQKDLANNSSHNCNAHCVASQLAQSASCVLGRIVAVGMHRDALEQEKILGAQEPLVQLAPVTMFPLAPAENQAWALAQHVCWLGPAAVDDPVSMEGGFFERPLSEIAPSSYELCCSAWIHQHPQSCLPSPSWVQLQVLTVAPKWYVLGKALGTGMPGSARQHEFPPRTSDPCGEVILHAER